MVLRSGGGIGSLTARLRVWWNWQTRYFEVVVPQGVQVQVLLRAPFLLRFPWETAEELQGAKVPDTEQTQNPPSDLVPENTNRRVKLPKVITHRRQKATIYGRTAKYPKYRLC